MVTTIWTPRGLQHGQTAAADMGAQHLLFTLAAGAFLVIVVLVVSSFSRRALTLANRRKELERLKSQETDSKSEDLKRGL